MSLKIKTTTEVTTIPYPKDGKEGGAVVANFQVKIPTPDELDKIINKNTRVEWDAPGKRQQKQRFKEPNYVGIAKARFQLIVVGWDGLTLEDGAEFPCTEDNKLIIFHHNREIVDYINDKVDEIMGLEKDEEEEEEKN